MYSLDHPSYSIHVGIQSLLLQEDPIVVKDQVPGSVAPSYRSNPVQQPAISTPIRECATMTAAAERQPAVLVCPVMSVAATDR